MGAWGEGVFENDAAADLRGLWDDYVLRGRAVDPDAWTSETIYDFFRRLYFRAAFHTGKGIAHQETAAEVLALGGLYLEYEIPIPPALHELVVQAAHYELTRAQLQDWASPQKRKRAVLKFLEAIGGTHVPEVKVDNPLAREVQFWKEFSKQYPRWIRIVKERRGSDEEANRIWPHWFFDDMGRAVGRGTRVNDWRLCNEAFKYRLMALSFALGWWLDLPEEHTLDLIEAAKRTRGEVGAIQYLGTEPE